MAINVSQAFHRTSANPVDESLALTKAQMAAVNDNLMPAKYLTVCQDDGAIYLYDKTNTATVETGKFVKFEGGGGGDTSKCYSTDDTAFTDVSTADYIPVYDVSDSTKKKSLWSNLKNVFISGSTAFTELADGDYVPVYDTSATTTKKTLWSNIKSLLRTYFNDYATSSTSAATTAKTATMSSGTFTLETGARVKVKFTYGNTATTPTLNVAGTGAKTIVRYGTTTGAAYYWNAGEVLSFEYDGNYWVLLNKREFTGATSSASGYAGIVPAPASGSQNYFLRGDGTWAAGHTLLTGTLTTAGWSSKSQTVTVNGVTADTNGVVGLLNTATAAEIEAAALARIRPTTLAANSITFVCENVPSVAIPFGVLVEN